MSVKVLRKMKSRERFEMRPAPSRTSSPCSGCEHRVEAEVHRAHVERAHLGLGAQRRGEALLQRHAVAAAGGDVDHRVGRLLDPRQELHEHLGVGRRPAVLRVARVQVQDRGAGLGRADRAVGDLLRGDRQVRAHGRRVDRAGDRAGDDDLVGGLLHGIRHDVHSPICSAARRFCAASAIRRRSRQTLRSARLSAGSAARRSPSIWRSSASAGPVQRRLLALDRLIERPVAAQIVGDAARRVEVDRLERPHERPAQADAVLDRDIDVRGRGDAVPDHAQRRAEQRRLHAVGDEARDLAAQADRRLAGAGHQRVGALDHRRIGPGRRAQLDQRRHVGRVDRMGDQAARAARRRAR